MQGIWINSSLHHLIPYNYQFYVRFFGTAVLLMIHKDYTDHYWNSWNLESAYGACA